MTQPSVQSTNWVRRFHPAPDAGVRLVCLPHAGGSASFFFPVSKALAPAVEVLAVQYPGRQDRRHEPLIGSVPGLAAGVVAALRQLDDERPLALFGHSMGAVVAYEVALRLPGAGLPMPVRVFASGRRAPSRYRESRIHLRSDAAIVAELQRLSGTDAAALTDPDMLAMIMPAVRSDYEAIETYRHEPGRTLGCPVTVLTGDADPLVSAGEAHAWDQHTTGPVDVTVLPGGHFFLVEQSGAVLEALRRELCRPAEATIGSTEI